VKVDLETIQLGLQILQGGTAAVLVVLGWIWKSFVDYQRETRKAIRDLEHAVIRLESQRPGTSLFGE